MQPFRRTISKLKLRASYGQTGNATLNGRRFAYLSTINDSWDDLKQYNWGTESGYNRNGMAEGEFAVPNLTWEVVNKANVGLELGLFNGMVDLQFDLFDERRHNIFMPRESIPITAGFIKQPWDNYGKMKNQGAEVTLNINKQFNKNLFVSLMGTLMLIMRLQKRMNRQLLLVQIGQKQDIQQDKIEDILQNDYLQMMTLLMLQLVL